MQTRFSVEQKVGFRNGGLDQPERLTPSRYAVRDGVVVSQQAFDAARTPGQIRQLVLDEAAKGEKKEPLQLWRLRRSVLAASKAIDSWHAAGRPDPVTEGKPRRVGGQYLEPRPSPSEYRQLQRRMEVAADLLERLQPRRAYLKLPAGKQAEIASAVTELIEKLPKVDGTHRSNYRPCSIARAVRALDSFTSDVGLDAIVECTVQPVKQTRYERIDRLQIAAVTSESA